MNQNEMQKIYGMSDKERDEYLNRFTPQERADYRAFEASMNAHRKNSLPASTKDKLLKVLRWIGIWLAIDVVVFFILRADVKSDLKKRVEQMYKDSGCVHGIQVDGQWFAHADDLTDYAIEKYGHLKYRFFYMSYGVDEFQCYSHPNGL